MPAGDARLSQDVRDMFLDREWADAQGCGYQIGRGALTHLEGDLPLTPCQLAELEKVSPIGRGSLLPGSESGLCNT